MEQNNLEQILEGRMKPGPLDFEILRKITNGFSKHRIIGEGGFATVYKGVIGNENVAVKQIRNNKTIDQKLFRREANSLLEVNHQNIVRFLGLCSHTVEEPFKPPGSRVYEYAEIRERLLCLEYIGNGSLDTKITDELRGLEWDKRYDIIKGICAGLHYLHVTKKIIHLDLKPANILLDDAMVPKITDFGLSRPIENSQTTSNNHYSSPGYGAPDYLLPPYMASFYSDIYSLGVIIIELVTGHKGIPEDSNNTLRRWRHRWNKSAKDTPLECHQQVTKCIEIGLHCVEIDCYARPTISEIMSKFDEMERMDNDNTSANESVVGQIISPYLEDDMLGVEPLELQFEYNKMKQILSCSVELSNDTDKFIAFKIQNNSQLPYSIESDKDIVKPRSKYIVDITLPTAYTEDHKEALQYSSTNRQFTVQSIKVNEGLTTDDIMQHMFKKHATGHLVDEINLAVVPGEPCSDEFIDVPSKQAKKQYASSGSVQLAIKNNTKAPLEEYNKTVVLELTGGDFTSDRPGLDLVTVVDVSGSMRGEKMEQLKTAMWFVMRKLRPIDRLSVVTFSDDDTMVCPLRQITEASQREWLELIDELTVSRGANIMDGLLGGLKLLAGRITSRGRIAAIMLVSDGHQSRGDATQVTVCNVPVYTFGLGADSDPMVLHTIAANSVGGTFSHVQDTGGLTMAFSQCLAGLLTVAAQDLEVTLAPVGDESTIVKVTAGSYTTRHHHDGSVTILFGNLYSWEVRNVVVDLLLHAMESGRERRGEVLKVTYSYNSSSSGKAQFVAPPETLTAWRAAEDVSEEETLEELKTEEAPLHMAKMIKEARACLET